jgi:hypothetical protein
MNELSVISESSQSKNALTKDFDPHILIQQKLAISYIIKLSQTNLSLSCQPFSKVALNLTVEEAELNLCHTPSSDQSQIRKCVNFVLNLRNVNGNLRHAYSPEDCLSLDIPLLNFTSGLLSQNLRDRFYSILLFIPGIAGSLNSRHLQDFYYFSKLWLEPYLSASNVKPALATTPSEFSAYVQNL